MFGRDVRPALVLEREQVLALPSEGGLYDVVKSLERGSYLHKSLCPYRRLSDVLNLHSEMIDHDILWVSVVPVAPKVRRRGCI